MTSYEEYRIEPLFPSPLGMTHISGDPSLTVEALKEVEWHEFVGGASTNTNFLTDFPVLKEQVMNAFNGFKNDYLGYRSTEFVMSSSWATRTDPGTIGVGHTHHNCMFSGVYYPFPGEYAGLELCRMGSHPSSFLIVADDENPLTIHSVTVTPHEGLIIFFPSYIHHQIHKNETENTRYSVAFNFFPVGTFGVGDSAINIVNVVENG